MLKDITSIKVSGATFESLTQLDFFKFQEGNKVKRNKGALLYGRNGTGKSTIAKAFRKLAGETSISEVKAEFYDAARQPVILTETEQKCIFVFDENYVDKNVRLQTDHLETIVMLGEAADLTDQIANAKDECDAAYEDLEKQKSVYDEYCDEKNIKSPKYYHHLIIDALRGDDNWAGRDKKINGPTQRQNSQVREDTYKQFVKLTPAKAKSELLSDYNIKLGELEAARTGASTIDKKVPFISKQFEKYDDGTMRRLLAEKIEKPELSEREKKLFELLQKGQGESLYERLAVFQSDKLIECPYCFQPITPEYRINLTKSIEKVLSKAVEDHRKDLQKFVLEPIIIELNLYERLNGYNKCVDLVEKINAAIQESNDNLKMKKDNPYEPIIIELTDIKRLVNQLTIALDNLEKSRLEYNTQIKQTAPIIAELKRINSEIAYYEIKDFVKQFEKQKREYLAADKLYDECKQNYNSKKRIVEELEAKRKNVRLALDSINACLKYIFFTDDRLEINYKDGAYVLLSHGKNVRPCDVSVGERNIIGLSYFFTSILEGQEAKDAYNKEYLLVIDDPISSYDLENRIGIMSFLKYKLSMFLEGNIDTKALVMTHDLMTAYEIDKIFKEIKKACNKQGYPSTTDYNSFELQDGKLNLVSYDKRQEYAETVKKIYAYASKQDNGAYELAIGNMMRQVLEAFSTFEYRKGIEEVSTDLQILKLLNEPEYIVYYKNLMYRLVLNGGSHRMEQVNSMKDLNFFTLISEEEKRRTAKDILCFIYLLNKMHLLEHLKGCKDVETSLESWCRDIRTRAAVI